MAFGDGVRERLRSRVCFNFNCTDVPEDPKERALFYWCALLGVFTHEMSEASSMLAIAGKLRGAAVLNRALFEYWLRLRYYTKKPEKAVEDLENHSARFKKLALAYPEEFSAVSRGQLEIVFGDVDGDAINRQIKHMVETMADNDAELVDVTYNWLYAMASMFVHGNEAAFFDLARTDSTSALPIPGLHSLDWESTHLTKPDVLANATSWALYMLVEIETISKRGAAIALLAQTYPKALRAVLGPD
jgi:hypothetical protein